MSALWKRMRLYFEAAPKAHSSLEFVVVMGDLRVSRERIVRSNSGIKKWDI